MYVENPYLLRMNLPSRIRGENSQQPEKDHDDCVHMSICDLVIICLM